jgi:hypothetical protein
MHRTKKPYFQGIFWKKKGRERHVVLQKGMTQVLDKNVKNYNV